MDRKKEHKPENLDKRLAETLDNAYETADNYFITGKEDIPSFASSNLSKDFIKSLDEIASLCEKASTGYLNIITGLTIKATLGDGVDVRYHQVQIQNQTDRRQDSISEVYLNMPYMNGCKIMNSPGPNQDGRHARLSGRSPICWIMMKI